MNNIKISLFASAVRPKLWQDFLKYVNHPDIEVIFSGNVDYTEFTPFIFKYKNFDYIRTANIKPAQCYEIARRHCKGEVVVWCADDCEFINNILSVAYAYWKSQDNEKLILSLQTKESGYGCKDGKLFNMKEHTFFSMMPETPLMAPIAMMSRKFLEDLGGFDRRFICGQYENFEIQLAYQHGAKVEIFGDENCYVDIDHLRKSIAIGESTDEESFRERPFAKGYANDRSVLEKSWTTFDQIEVFKILESGKRPFSLRKVSPIQLDKFEPYEDKNILIKSQSNNLPEIWD